MAEQAQSTPFLKSPGIRTFLTIWFGQLISSIGSNLTGFAMGVYIYEKTDNVWWFVANFAAYNIPHIIIAPFTGALVDRIDRKWAMIVSDTGAGLSTLAVVLLYLGGMLEPWHVIVSTFFNTAFNTIQWPAWSAAQTLLVPKEHLGRAGGMSQLGDAIGQLLAPAIAGVLYVTIGLSGIVAIDFATFAFAVLTLLIARVPKPEQSALGAEQAKSSIWQDAQFGFKYIWARKPLLGLLTYFASINFFSGMVGPFYTPLLLTIATPEVMGLVGSIIGLGMLAGTLVMSAWGGTKRKIAGLLGFGAVGGLFTMVAGARMWLPLITFGAFGMLFTMPILNASSQAIWQRKVEPDLQGRVFSARRVIAWGTSLPAAALGAWMVTSVLQPFMDLDGPLAGTQLGALLELGPGRGISMLMVLTGLLTVIASGVYRLIPAVWHVEDRLPDAVSAVPQADQEAVDGAAEAGALSGSAEAVTA